MKPKTLLPMVARTPDTHARARTAKRRFFFETMEKKKNRAL
jgi:hypothetical protein